MVFLKMKRWTIFNVRWYCTSPCSALRCSDLVHVHRIHVHLYTCIHVSVFSEQDPESAGIIVYQFHGPLCFVNISVFQKRLKLAVHVEARLKDTESGGCLKTLALKVTYKCMA